MKIASAIPHGRPSKARGPLERALTRTLPARRRHQPTPIARLADRVAGMRRRVRDRGAKPVDRQPDPHRRPRDMVASAANRLTAGRR